MKTLSRLSVLGLLSPVLGFLSGCNLPTPQADPVRHFTLSSPAGAGTDRATVRPVQLAGHLHGRPMAVRVSENEVIYLEDVRWAEPLDAAITQVLRARVGTAGAGHVVMVQIQRCELVRFDGNKVQLIATYTIMSPGSATQSGAFTASPRSWDGKDYGALVGLIRDAVGEFGDTLAAALVGPK